MIQKPVNKFNIHRAYRLSKKGMRVHPFNVLAVVKELRSAIGDQTLYEEDLNYAEGRAERNLKTDPEVMVRLLDKLHEIKGSDPSQDRYKD